jgi:nucleotide-binding universal stress UspA family protein
LGQGAAAAGRYRACKPSLLEAAKMFKHILVPTDGSKLSEKAIKHAMQFAKQCEARVTALHVIPKFHTFTYQADMLELTEKEYVKSGLEHANQYLRYAQRVANNAGVECSSAHASSDQPYKEIIKAAQKKGCDLILMASHGRRGIEGFLLGSETQKVLTHSHVPVLVFR